MRKPLGEAWPPSPVTILVPPPVFEKEDAILHLPVVTNRCQEVVGADGARINAGEKITRIGESHRTIFSNHVTIYAQRDLTTGKVQLVADVLNVI